MACSGVVDAVGEKVTKFRRGDNVMAYGAISAFERRFGSYAEFLACPRSGTFSASLQA